MRLSWNEIRARAAEFARRYASATREASETQSFYNDFFQIFGVQRRSVARYEEQVKLLDNSRGFIDLFWPGVLLVEQKSAGRNLEDARLQAAAYFDALPERERPRYQLLCDFKTFELLDRDERERVVFTLAELPQNIEKFGFILGIQKRAFKDQDPVNIRASCLVGELHDALKSAGYDGHDVEQFLVRIVFCLFADNTGIFALRGLFLELIENRTRPDGSDLGNLLSQLFQVLNTASCERQKTLDEDLSRFPHINGDLFRDALRIPAFDATMRHCLISACRFDWSAISPAIFGSLFQSVMEAKKRRAQGAHYTTEKNILKVIEPLFLDDLRAEFKRLKTRRDKQRRTRLMQFQQHLGEMCFLDPACGCGNFLIIAYRELRSLEIEIIREIRAYDDKAGQWGLHAADLSHVNVDQFYGMELGEFPSRIAEAALWMMDHIMNNRLSLEFGQQYARIPLAKSPHIRHCDALESNWEELLPSQKCSFVFGNPPFIGQSYQSPAQRQQMRYLMDAKGKNAGSLDYVGAWFLRAAKYVQKGNAHIGFVATNSITQGEQVAQLWPLLIERYKLHIIFAHRTFAWGSDARGMAHVHVVIVGLAPSETAPLGRRLFSYHDVKGEPHESQHAAISPYLFDASGLSNPHIIVRDTLVPLTARPQMLRGVQATDGGHYLLRGEQRDIFLSKEPDAVHYLRPYLGAQEHLQSKQRWILYLEKTSPEELKAMPHVIERIRLVREMRMASKKPATQRLAETPTLLEGRAIPTAPFLVMPGVSSERREYVPIGWQEPPVIPSNAVFILEGATKPLFALLTSAMHMAWLRYIGGRLKSDYRYSISVVYNTFPLPSVSEEKLQTLAPLVDAVLDARATHLEVTLADLYDPDLMPPTLRKAHRVLDRAVDRLYQAKAFTSERERVEHLFVLYEKLIGARV